MGTVLFRLGQPEDAEAIALLFDMANAGLVAQAWGEEAEEGETWLDVAKRTIQDPHCELSYAHTIVAELEGRVVGMLICTQQPTEIPPFDPESVPSGQRPFLVLRSKVPGGYLLRDIAVFPEYRGLGIASKLFDLAISAAYHMGFDTILIITHESNEKLLEHYARRGMKVVASHAAGDHPAYAPDSKWLLLTCHKPDGIMNFTYKETDTNGK